MLIQKTGNDHMEVYQVFSNIMLSIQQSQRQDYRPSNTASYNYYRACNPTVNSETKPISRPALPFQKKHFT